MAVRTKEDNVNQTVRLGSEPLPKEATSTFTSGGHDVFGMFFAQQRLSQFSIKTQEQYWRITWKYCDFHGCRAPLNIRHSHTTGTQITSSLGQIV